MYRLIRPLLFRLDAEQTHDWTLALLRAAGRYAATRRALQLMYEVRDARLEVNVFGIRFSNPVGLAAGFDKNGVAVRALGCLGFGHVEVGTLTLEPQAGNPRPRIHRVVEAGALINSMGFPNQGAGAARVGDSGVVIGANIGRGRSTPPERAPEEYGALLRQVQPWARYVALNVSSPNTPGLRQLQARPALGDVLRAAIAQRDQLTPRVPLLLKVAPDLTEREIDDLLVPAVEHGVDGIIATNTTLSRAGVPSAYTLLPGGLSGGPLRARSTEIIRSVARSTGGRMPIIGVGGIRSAQDALEKLCAGAQLVQVYTGLVYAGPSLARQISAGLLQMCKQGGFESLRELAASEA